MNYIQCPENYFPGYLASKPPAIFLAGGITSCPLWQDEAVKMFADTRLTILNPRREIWNDSIKDEDQITWEYSHINAANFVLFWFPPDTLCPITLLELGKLLSTYKEITIGIHPDYKKRNDVIIQTKLARSNVQIHSTLEDTVNFVKKKYEAWK